MQTPSPTSSSDVSLREAAVVAGVPFEFAEREVQKRALKVLRKNKHLFVAPEAATYLALVHNAPFDMSPKLRAALYVALTEPASSRSKPWELKDTTLRLFFAEATMAIDMKITDDRVKERLALWASRTERITTSDAVMSGEPVFRGTRIPLDHIVTLLRSGTSREYFSLHFPTLLDEHVELARLFVQMGPRPGRPRLKRLKLRRRRSA